MRLCHPRHHLCCCYQAPLCYACPPSALVSLLQRCRNSCRVTGLRTVLTCGPLHLQHQRHMLYWTPLHLKQLIAPERRQRPPKALHGTVSRVSNALVWLLTGHGVLQSLKRCPPSSVRQHHHLLGQLNGQPRAQRIPIDHCQMLRPLLDWRGCCAAGWERGILRRQGAPWTACQRTRLLYGPVLRRGGASLRRLQLMNMWRRGGAHPVRLYQMTRLRSCLPTGMGPYCVQSVSTYLTPFFPRNLP
mmetsp:Transcript_18342/g.55240  ORF Transcript_18342/g.55240 Transcript_18342/m.55240 type:complete len:245 (-) Transcript_18342:65-799(-)